MGIVIRQSIKGTIVNYTGVLIGMVTAILILPRLLRPEEIGLVRFIQSTGILFSSMCLLGLQQSMLKFAPRHNADNTAPLFNGTNIMLLLAGSVVVLTLFGIFCPSVLALYKKDEGLISFYRYAIFIIIAGQAVITFFEVYCMTQYRIVVPALLREIVNRLLVIAIALLYFYKVIGQSGFVYSYSFIYVLLGGVICLYAFRMHFRLQVSPAENIALLREQGTFPYFAFLITAALNLQMVIDSLLIPRFLDLYSLGIYATVAVIASVIQIPYRSVSAIVSPLFAEAWHEQDMAELDILYKRSGLGIFIAGLWLYMVLTINAHDVLSFLPAKYSGTEFLIIMIGLARLADVLFGLNGELIEKSPMYKFNVLLIFITLILSLVFNVWFIKLWGIKGVAFSLCLSMLITNGMRAILLKKYYNLLPFTRATFWVLLLGGILTVSFYYIKVTDIVLVNIIIKTLLTTIVYVFFIYKYRLSPDFIHVANTVLRRAKLLK